MRTRIGCSLHDNAACGTCHTAVATRHGTVVYFKQCAIQRFRTQSTHTLLTLPTHVAHVAAVQTHQVPTLGRRGASRFDEAQAQVQHSHTLKAVPTHVQTMEPRCASMAAASAADPRAPRKHNGKRSAHARALQLMLDAAAPVDVWSRSAETKDQLK